jgi:hypothetical protein
MSEHHNDLLNAVSLLLEGEPDSNFLLEEAPFISRWFPQFRNEDGSWDFLKTVPSTQPEDPRPCLGDLIGYLCHRQYLWTNDPDEYYSS